MQRDLVVYLELGAVFAGALSGVLHGLRRGFDLVGVATVGVVTGLGGGFVRDALLGEVALALRHSSYLTSSLLAVPAGVLLATLAHRLEPWLRSVDALTLGLFALAGLKRAQDFGLDLAPALLLGVVTGVGGSVLRDVLCREDPVALLPGAPYATVALFSELVFVVARRWLPVRASFWIALAGAVLLRMAGTRFGFRVPMPPDLTRPRRRG